MARYYIGTSGWHYDDWRGRFYPEKLPKAKWLEYYARHFSTVELNNSFYRLPSEAAFTNWYDSSPSEFAFAVKMSRFVTHIKRLKGSEEAVDNFINRAKILGEKLGPILYQLPPSMHRNDETLSSFLSSLPVGFQHVIEFRHQSWLVEEVFEVLKKHRAGLCVFDMPDFTCPLLATADFAYIRFHGSDSLYSSCYSDEALADWAKRIAEMAENLDSVYIYFNNDVQGFAVKNAETIRSFLV
jgi:uncharacterized protein YecE (DUF72 family)